MVQVSQNCNPLGKCLWTHQAAPEFPSRPKALPDAASLLTHHGLTGFAGERLGKLLHVGDHSVDAEFVRRMLVGHRVEALVFRPLIAACPLRHPDEEALLRRETVDRL